jgi:hypothetical protein
MSSIYRKGRDGYFYYQAYIVNPETGKKDKRVFHSLNTKDKLVAKDKQIFFDAKYDKKKKIKQKVFQKSLLIFSLFSILLISFNYINSKLMYHNNEKANDEVLQKELRVVGTNIDTIKSNPFQDSTEISMKNTKNGIDTDNYIIGGKNKIPKYTIARKQSLRDRFDQVKVFVTVPPNSKEKEIESLCKKLKNDFDKYSNILICIYAENEEGILMANGLSSMIDKSDTRDVWLAMYSYNPIEGEYFDSEPSNYLGQRN